MGLFDYFWDKKEPTQRNLARKKKDEKSKGTFSLSGSKENLNGKAKSRHGTVAPKQPEVRTRSPHKGLLLRKEAAKSTVFSDNEKSKVTRQRPVSIATSSNISHRRGQAPSSKIEDNRDDLSRTSSISNLNADAKGSRGAKPKKAASRDRLDKIGDKKHDKKGLTKNNNKLETNEYSPEAVNPTIDILQKQLAEMATEKSNLALQLGEQKGQLNILQKEIEKLKHSEEESNMQLDKLVEENTALRNRLRDVAHSPLSDNEKQQLLFESQRHHSSAPASIASNILDDMQGDVTACTTPEWDKHSSGNVSEISVACLQDKINQMQETHYSTNEELQATLQELTDLQRQLTELQQENERLTEEKTLMFDSLCRQTERLNDARSEVESLKQLLYKEKDEHAASNFESAVEREKKLVELLKSAQEEREGHLLKIEQLTGELQECRSLNEEREGDVVNLSERVKTLESTLDAKHAEHKQLDQELALAKDQCSSRQIEINRLKDLLDNARTKINELEQDRALSDKSELDELLDNARKEKDALESEVADLKEQVARSKNEAEKFKEQVSILQEECKVTRNNAKTTQSDLEYKCEKLQMEKASITEQLQHFQEVVNELQVQSQCQLEDKRQLSAVLSETQRNLSESEEKNLVLMAEVDELKKIRKEETEDWEKFQDDLLTSVRVANDFKTEAQKELQKFVLDNKSLRERVRQLESQIDKLKAQNAVESTVQLRPTSFPNDEFASRRQKAALSRQNSRQSVKSLIESIENAAGSKPPTKTGLGVMSRSSSSSSINSMASDVKSPSSPSLIMPTPSPGSPLKTPDWTDQLPPQAPPSGAKTPLKEQQPNKLGWSAKTVISDSLNKPDMCKTKQDENYRESILQKGGIDFARRNSCSDLSIGERKDPLNSLVKNGGSKRNALLKWCQNKCVGYRNTDITNFSSSWNDGLALCALLHTYLPDRIPYDSLTPQEKRRNFSLAFAAAESVGITTTLNINDMIQLERPDWQQVMSYVTAIYKHFET
ncbi:cytospin-A isoform X5 [Aethina tumida]|uniref:cytospin-A isoform X5 n=1 Tax=Aethina tumida TaxID=116153 RepID=UPI002148BCB0|nr:cytospin-A isoform X5 [Aethina tumida]